MQEQIDQKKVIETACALVENATGVQFGSKQMKMVESRLRRHLSDLGLDFSSYLSYLKENEAKEKEALISLLTTHHTYFFREFVHFEYLESALPQIRQNVLKRGGDKIEVWSAACSRGQEVYSLAMHLHAHLQGFPFKIFGTDVDKDSVKIASNGVYKYEEIKEVPLAYLSNHWARGTGNISDYVKVKKSLRESCDFAPGNLLDLSSLQGRKFDVIFCRNVFIYFTLDQVKQITETLKNHLYPGGVLIIGLSESLHGLNTNLKAVGPSVYQLEEKKQTQTPEKGRITSPPVQEPSYSPTPSSQVGRSPGFPIGVSPDLASSKAPAILRVVCIDDSNSILTLMKKILTKEKGFEIVGTAENGQIGAEKVKELKPDLVTLDLHMPVCGGIEYLEKFQKADSPPVIVVSSVNREDTELAQRALKLGASDYVEKPALNNLKERSEELYSKLRTAWKIRGQKKELTLDSTFAAKTEIASPENQCRILLCKNSELEKVIWILNEGLQVPTYIAVEGSPKDAFDTLKAKGFRVQAAPSIPSSGSISVGEVAMVKKATQTFSGKLSLMVFGQPKAYPELLQYSQLQVLAEDLGSGKAQEPYASKADDILPVTSFSFLANQYFSKREKKAA